MQRRVYNLHRGTQLKRMRVLITENCGSFGSLSVTSWTKQSSVQTASWSVRWTSAFTSGKTGHQQLLLISHEERLLYLPPDRVNNRFRSLYSFYSVAFVWNTMGGFQEGNTWFFSERSSVFCTEIRSVVWQTFVRFWKCFSMLFYVMYY